jgi:hypothetical protein
MRRLPNDIARCHDDQCPLRNGCLRWEQRKTGRVHALGTMQDEKTGWCFERITEGGSELRMEAKQ